MTKIIIIGIVLFPSITSCSYKKGTEPTYNDTISYETISRTSENCDDCITCNDCKEWQALLRENDILMQKITSHISQEIILDLLHKEKSLTDSLINAKHMFLIHHWDRGYETHDWSRDGYEELAVHILRYRKENLNDLYMSLIDSSYSSPRKLFDIPKFQFTNAYTKLRHNVGGFNDIYASPESDYPKFDRKLAEKLLDDEYALWQNLMEIRTRISGLLNSSPKAIFDNGTKRLKFLQLVQLKNEYMEYGKIGREVEYCCLSDSCSYESLMDYDCFTNEMNDFHLRMYHSN